MRPILVLALLLSPVAAASDATEALSTAREDLMLARGDFKKLARVEKDAIRDARTAVATTARGRALAPTFAVAADTLEGVRGQAKEDADLLGQMAESYRAMAAELDKEIAPEAKANLAKLLEEAAAEKDETGAKRAWRLVKRGDPRYRALARNMKELNAALASLEESDGPVGDALVKVRKLNEALAPLFEGVETARPEPPAAACPT